MNKKFFWLSIIAVLTSFAGGFLLANALNRSEINTLSAENARLKKNAPAAADESAPAQQLELSAAEIDKKIAEAAENPNDFAFQKGLGLGLYRYAMLKQDTKLLGKISELLERARRLNPDDYEVIVSLGNVYFDLGQMNSDEESNLKARDLYSKALEKNPQDANVRTDLGLTFLLTQTPNLEKSVRELEKALEINPKNERALQYLTRAYFEKGDSAKAEEILNKLKTVNSKNPGINDLEKRIAGNKK